jgi:hypothetical protein
MEQGRAGEATSRPEDDPDEEFPELAAKARKRAREQERLQDTQAAPEADPVLSILIHSDIPETAPLLVKRRYRQTFKDVRKAWCSKNSIPEPGQNDVFFTFRGRKVFDVATPKSLGIKLDYDGSPVLKGEDGYSEPGDKIDFIATTLAIMEQQRKDALDELEARLRAEKEREQSVLPENQEKQYRVIMRSKGHPDHKILVREVFSDHLWLSSINYLLESQSTEVQRIAGVFRRQYQIEADKRITIIYDGEELSPDMQVKDTEIIELDPGEPALLEVYIK